MSSAEKTYETKDLTCIKNTLPKRTKKAVTEPFKGYKSIERLKK